MCVKKLWLDQDIQIHINIFLIVHSKFFRDLHYFEGLSSIMVQFIF